MKEMLLSEKMSKAVKGCTPSPFPFHNKSKLVLGSNSFLFPLPIRSPLTKVPLVLKSLGEFVSQTTCDQLPKHLRLLLW